MWLSNDFLCQKSKRKCQVSIESQREKSSETVLFLHISDIKTIQKRTLFLPCVQSLKIIVNSTILLLGHIMSVRKQLDWTFENCVVEGCGF